MREVIIEALRGDGRELAELILSSEEARLALAKAIAGEIVIPLNVATKEDLRRIEEKMATKEDLKQFATKDDLEKFATKEDVKRIEGEIQDIRQSMATKEDLKQYATKEDLAREVKRLEEKMATKQDVEELKRRLDEVENKMATKEDLKRLEDKMATKEQLERIMVSLEEEARDVVRWLLKQRGITCVPDRLFLDSDYEFDIYCTTGELTVVGEAKVRAGPNAVERLAARIDEAARRWPEKFQGKLVKVLYCNIAMPGAVEKAKELGIWLVENLKERTELRL